MKKISTKKPHKEAHVNNTGHGSGDYYGTGVKNPVGRVREDYINGTSSPKKLGKPPKSLA